MDYYDRPAAETQFLVDSNNINHIINGTNSVLISCNELRRINMTGFKIFDEANYTMNLTSHAGSRSVIVELSPCHPGFYHDNKRCVCYHDNDIITCSGITSFIRRGYWFGLSE